MMLTVNLLRAARSCPVKSTPPSVLSRRTSPHPIQRTRGCGADGGAEAVQVPTRKAKKRFDPALRVWGVGTASHQLFLLCFSQKRLLG